MFLCNIQQVVIVFLCHQHSVLYFHTTVIKENTHQSDFQYRFIEIILYACRFNINCIIFYFNLFQKWTCVGTFCVTWWSSREAVGVAVTITVRTLHSNVWCLMVFNATFNNSSVISWRFAYLVKETGVPGENHPHWQTLSHNVVHLALIEILNHNISGDGHWLHR